MSDDFQPYLDHVATGQALSRDQAKQAFELIMTGHVDEIQISGFLMAMRGRGETIEEITGAAEVMRDKAQTIKAPNNAIDVCGTGGSGISTFNISTACAIVLAACGITIAKHGNRAASSKSGSADVLEKLGINLDADMDNITRGINDIGIGFMYARRHHNAMRHVAAVRSGLKTRTMFNLLGPLSNPAGTKRQLMGVFGKEWTNPIAHVLGALGSEKVWVVHGSDGLDELTITGPSYVSEYHNGQVRDFTITPEDAGLSTYPLDDILGGDADHNANALKGVLQGDQNAYRDVVLLNSAAGIVVSGQTDNLKQAVKITSEVIDNKKAQEKLDQWISLSNQDTSNG